MPPNSISLTETVTDQTTQQAITGLEAQIWSTPRATRPGLATAAPYAMGQWVGQLSVAIQGLAVRFNVPQDRRQLELGREELNSGGRKAKRAAAIRVFDATGRDYGSQSAGYRGKWRNVYLCACQHDSQKD